MPSYISMLTYTEQGIAGIKKGAFNEAEFRKIVGELT